jgi:hypothetical protein
MALFKRLPRICSTRIDDDGRRRLTSIRRTTLHARLLAVPFVTASNRSAAGWNYVQR